MLKRFFLLLHVFTCVYAHSQGIIKGRVLDEDGKTPIEFANVQLRQSDSLIIGTVTDERGFYNLNPVHSGEYVFVISFVGYKDYKTEIGIYGTITKIMNDVKLASSGKISEVIIRRDCISTFLHDEMITSYVQKVSFINDEIKETPLIECTTSGKEKSRSKDMKKPKNDKNNKINNN